MRAEIPLPQGLLLTIRKLKRKTITGLLIQAIKTAEITGSTLKGKVYTRALKTVSNLKLVIDGIGDVVTDKDGYFEFKNVKPGKYTVYTTFENGKKYVLRELEIKESVELSVKLLYDIKTGADKNEDQNGVNVLLIVLSAAAGVAVIGGAAVLIIFRKRIFK